MSWELQPDGSFVEVDDGQDQTYSNTPAPAAPQVQSGGPSKVTYYGYEKRGDPDYDSNSAAGIGDRQNQLYPGQSVALSQSERLARFGVTGKSTGLPVQVGGATFYDHDTSPQPFRNIDVYSPAGPGRNFKTWGGGQSTQVQQYPYDPDKDPFMQQEAANAPAQPPPTWDSLTQSDSWQGLSPEDKGKVTDQWYSQTYGYASSLGDFDPTSRKALYDFYQDARKQVTASPPLDLGKTASDSIKEYGRSIELNTVNSDLGALEQKQKFLNEQTSGLNQQIANIKMDATLTDAQKEQSIKTLQDQFDTLKNKLIPQWAEDKKQQQSELIDNEDPKFTQSNLGKGVQLAAKITTGAAQMGAGAPLGPEGMALTSGMSGGSESYEEARLESKKWMDEHMPMLSEDQKTARANEAAQQIANIETGFSAAMGLTGGIRLPIQQVVPKILMNTLLQGGIGAGLAGTAQHERNIIERGNISPSMTGEWTGVPEAASVGGLTTMLGAAIHEGAGHTLGKFQNDAEYLGKDPAGMTKEWGGAYANKENTGPAWENPNKNAREVEAEVVSPQEGQKRLTEGRTEPVEQAKPEAPAAPEQTGEAAKPVETNQSPSPVAPSETTHPEESAARLTYVGAPNSEPESLKAAALFSAQQVADPNMKALALHIANMVPETAVWDMANFSHPVTDSTGRALPTSTTAGIYHPDSQMALISHESTDPAAAILHEAGHAALAAALDDPNNTMDPGFALIQKAYRQAQIAAKSVSNPPVWLSYALSNIHEFASSVVSDPVMQNWLKRVVPEQGRTTPFNNLVNGTRQILGIPTAGKGAAMRNALQGLLTIQTPQGTASGPAKGTVFASSPFFQSGASNSLPGKTASTLGTLRRAGTTALTPSANFFSQFPVTQHLGPLIRAIETSRMKYLGPRSQSVEEAKRLLKAANIPKNRASVEVGELQQNPNAKVSPEARQIRNKFLRHYQDAVTTFNNLKVPGGTKVFDNTGRAIVASTVPRTLGQLQLGVLKPAVQKLVNMPAKLPNGQYTPEFLAVYNEGVSHKTWSSPSQLEELLFLHSTAGNSRPGLSSLERLDPKWPGWALDTSIDALETQAREHADALARIEHLGQSYAGHPDALEIAKERVGRDLTLSKAHRILVQDAIDLAADEYYHDKSDAFSRMVNSPLQSYGSLASSLQAATPEVSMTVFLNRVAYQWSSYGMWNFVRAMGDFLKDPRNVLDAARTIGVNQNMNSYFHEFHDPHAPGTPQWIQHWTTFAMEASGHGIAYRWPSAWMVPQMRYWIQQAIRENARNPKGIFAKMTRQQLERLPNVDVEAVLKGDPEAIDHAIRQGVTDVMNPFLFSNNMLLNRTPFGRLILRYTHWALNTTRIGWRDYVQPIGQAMAAGDHLLAAAYMVRLLGYLAAVFASLEMADEIRHWVFGQESNIATLGQFMNFISQGHYGKALAALTEHMWHDAMSENVVGVVGGWGSKILEAFPGHQKPEYEQARAWNPAQPPGFELAKQFMNGFLKWQANPGAYTHPEVFWKEVDNMISQTFGGYRATKRAVQSAAQLAGLPSAAGIRDRNFVYAREEQFYEANPNKRPPTPTLGPRAATPYYDVLVDRLYAGDVKGAREIVSMLEKDPQVKDQIRKLGQSIHQSIANRAPVKPGATGEDFMNWAHANLPADEIQRIQHIDQLYKQTATAAGLIAQPRVSTGTSNRISKSWGGSKQRSAPSNPETLKYSPFSWIPGLED